MKTLTLIRHAKSSWKNTELEDFDRPLNKRGKKDLPGLAIRVGQQLPKPDCLLYSPALRTRLTSEPLIVVWRLTDQQVKPLPEAYEASSSTLLKLLRKTPDTCQHLVLIGHNPGLAELTSRLTGQALLHFPTAAVAHLCLTNEHWATLDDHCASLSWFDYPKKHRLEDL